MFKNYFKTAWRNLAKHKLFSFINIFGLASGMAICMLALIKIKDAYDYDNFHPNSKNSYRILTNLSRKNGDHFLCASSPLAVASYLKSNYKEIQKSSSIYFSHEEVTANNKTLAAKEAYVDVDFYKIFGFRLSKGSAATTRQTAVLTAETATKFFGKSNPVGQTLTIGNSDNFLVTGVLEKPSFPSHLKFDLLVSTAALPLTQRQGANAWADEAAAYTYIQARENTSSQSLQNILNAAGNQANAIVTPLSGKHFTFDLQPLSSISPGTKPLYNLTDEPIAPNLIAFGLIAFFMLLLAFFNYINLTLSRSLDRAREVGVRKVAGARRKDVMLQFLSESVMVSVLAFCIALLQLKLLLKLPTVQAIVGDSTLDTKLWLYFISFALITGLTAGWIPAKVFSGFKPVSVLKSKFNAKLFGGVGLRKALTVSQFALSLMAIVTLVIFYRQSTYMANADYGFEKEGLLNIQLPQQSYSQASVEFASSVGVEQVSGTSGLFGFSEGDNKFIKRNNEQDSIAVTYFSVSASFITNMGLQIIAGTKLPEANVNKNVSYVMINEEACKVFKFKDPSEAVGKALQASDSNNYVVAGVVKDFHYSSFIQPIRPLLLANKPDEFKILNLKIAAAAAPTIKPSLESHWKKLFPHQPFESQWLKSQLHDQHMHKDDLTFIGLLTIMALLIACLGLLGMVIYTTKNRSKEVSIRRVLGAGIGQVMVEISREFFFLLLIAVCIGLPLGILTGSQFLQQYAYRIQINFSMIAACAAALLLIGGATIGWQVYRTAISNPAKSLRIE